MKKVVLLVGITIGAGFSYVEAQEKAKQSELSRTLSMERVTGITVDGVPDEEVWEQLTSYNQFIKQYPADSGLAYLQTEVKIGYDDDFIYIGAYLHDNGGKRTIQSLKRDNSSHWSSDAFSVIFDPIGEKTNGYLFGVNAGGAQYETTLNIQGTWTDADENWDNKWFSATQQYIDYWFVEMAIPFKTLRYSPASTEWRMNFMRNDMANNEFSTWNAVPRNFSGYDLNYTGVMSWPEPPPKSKGNIAIIPYTSGEISKNHEELEDTRYAGKGGLDAKIGITSSLNLDLTINPDFSNVDVDQQVTNLDRFSLFFPEKRSFFLENSDLFSNFGPWRISPFFSRRIGLNDGEPIPILFGARISGNISKGLRIGIMDVQTRKTSEFDAQNYGVAAFQQTLFGKSSIRGIFVNRQQVGETTDATARKYNRVGGLEFQYRSMNGKVGGNLRYHASFNPEKFSDADLYSMNINYQGRSFFTGFTADRVGKNFILESGFNPRLDNYDPVGDTTIRIGFTRFNPWIGYDFFGKEGSFLNRHGPRAWAVLFLNNDGSLSELSTTLIYDFNFRNTGGGFVRVRNVIVELPYALDFIEDATPLPAARYNYTEFTAGMSSDSRKVFSYELGGTYGSFYNGEKFSGSASVNLRAQPWGNFGVSYNANYIHLPGEYGSTTFHLIGPKTEISFSNKMFWTSFLQYNNQAKNFNINSRFQWRYRPMSDIFLVYSDNYTTPALNTKNRAIVLKVTYWLNL